MLIVEVPWWGWLLVYVVCLGVLVMYGRFSKECDEQRPKPEGKKMPCESTEISKKKGVK